MFSVFAVNYKVLRVSVVKSLENAQVRLKSFSYYNIFIKPVSAQKPMNVFLDIIYDNNEPIKHIVKQQGLIPEVITPQHFKGQKVKNKSKKGERYRWSQAENIRYVKFLIKRGKLFSLSFKQRKKIQINKKMSQAVKTRSPSQCHTHHQKMMLKFQSIEKIIEYYLTSTRDPKLESKTQQFDVLNIQKEEVQESIQVEKMDLGIQNLFIEDQGIVFNTIERFDSYWQYFDI